MSANRSHLVAEPRVNKLGQTVIKHVKPSQPTGNTAIPVPTMASMKAAPPQDRDEAADRLVDQINPSFLYGSGSTTRLRDILGEVSDEYFAVIAAASDRDLKDNKGNRQLLIYSAVAGLDERQARETLYFLPCMENWVDTEGVIHHVRGLHQLDMFKDMETTEGITGKNHHVASAILKLAPMLSDDIESECLTFGETDGHTWIAVTNPDFLALVTEHPDKADMMADFIAERDFMCSVSQIRSYVENDTPLRDGIL